MEFNQNEVEELIYENMVIVKMLFSEMLFSGNVYDIVEKIKMDVVLYGNVEVLNLVFLLVNVGGEYESVILILGQGEDGLYEVLRK